MADMREDQDQTLADKEDRLRALEREKEALENRPHSGFADAARVAKLASEIEALGESVARERQSAVQGEG